MKKNSFFSGLRIALFALVLIAGCVIGFMTFLRPTFSENEKRTLTEFPDFTLDSFLSGEWTEQVSLWYADSFPFRETLLSLNDRLHVLDGLSVADVNSQGRGEEIPEDETVIWQPDTQPGADESGSDPGETESVTEAETGAAGEQIEGYYVDEKAKTGYELYYFHKDLTDRYARLVVNAAYRLDGRAQVYDMVVPLSYCFGMDPALRESIGVSDGIASIDYIYRTVDSLSAQAGLEKPVITLDVAPTLREHFDEYVFFRTDHHWTARGAYYASRVFLDAAGREGPALDDPNAYVPYEFPNFFGTLYTNTKNQVLRSNPDTVQAWASRTADHVTIHTREGDIFDAPLIQPETETRFYNTAYYRCFVDGDYPFYEIHNETVTDGSKVLVIKESYGNAFLPVSCDSFEYVYAMDYRFFMESMVQFVLENDVDTVIFVNNLIATGADYNVKYMEKLVNR